ncbi:MAG: PAS domain S-box protein [Siculibacillus sp.]
MTSPAPSPPPAPPPPTARVATFVPDMFVSPAPGRRDRTALLIEATPLVVMVVIVVLMGVLVWLADRRERQEASDNLIRDTLWVEQALRFQIDAARDGVERLAFDLSSAPMSEDRAAARMRTLVTSHPEIVEFEWRDESGAVRVAVPPDGVAEAPEGPAVRPPRGFGEPRRAAGLGGVVDLVIPVFDHDMRVGRLIARVQLDRLLALHVPWWISQNNRVALLDRDGAEIAAKSAPSATPATMRHVLAFDPPLPGVELALAARHDGSGLTRNVLGAGILGLAVVALVSLVGLMRHYRRRKAAERSLEEAQALRRAMEESLTIGMRARDLDDRIIYVNPAFCRMVGWSAEEVVGRTPPLPYWLPDLVDETLARHHTLAHAALEPISFETRFRRRDGTVFDVLVYEAPLIDATGAHRGWMGSIIDVTEAKRAEERERVQAEKMTRTGRLISLGEMASTISHELNQPLAAISSYASGCLHLVREGRPSSDLVGALEKLDAQAQRAGQVIRRVHDFVRKREPMFAAVDVVGLVAALIPFVALDAKKAKVEIVLDGPDEPVEVTADRILLEQVLVNLMRNGAEAMAGVRPKERRLEVTVTPPAADGPRTVSIAIADRGCGISAETADRLFSPFFSTKPEGMGMGLSICRSIVERHQGRLEFASRVGGGTVFTVTLPVAEKGTSA